MLITYIKNHHDQCCNAFLYVHVAEIPGELQITGNVYIAIFDATLTTHVHMYVV